MDIHTLVQWEQGTELSADVRLDLLKDIEQKKNEKRSLMQLKKKQKTAEEEEMKRAHLSITSDFDGLMFVPGVGQVSRLSERKLSPGKT